MELSKFIESKDSWMRITVNYNRKDDAISEIISVTIFKPGLYHHIDVTDIFMKHFDKDLDKLIMETNWRELYKMQIA